MVLPLTFPLLLLLLGSLVPGFPGESAPRIGGWNASGSFPSMQEPERGHRGSFGASHSRIRVLPRGAPELQVLVEEAPSERGFRACPENLRPWIEALDAPESSTREEARRRLAAIDWRNHRWLRDRAYGESRAELRLALRAVLARLRLSRYRGLPPGR